MSRRPTPTPPSTTIPIRKIQRTWLSSNGSCGLIISKGLATKHGLTEPTDIILEDTPNGILIRKLDINKI